MTNDDSLGANGEGHTNQTVERFVPIQRSLSLSDEVAEVLLRRIREGPMLVGTRFPSERELSEQFNVSRTVIREAIRSLAAKGVINVQSGRGLTVSRVDAVTVRESMSLYLLGLEELDYGIIHEVRAAIELEVVELAALRATPAEVKILSEVCERMAERVGDMEFTAKADVEFHRTLAKMTHNPLFTILLDSIGDILLEIRLEVMVMSDEPLRGINFHRRILAQVAAGDSKGARLVMEEHLADAENIWRELGHGVALHSTAKSTEA